METLQTLQHSGSFIIDPIPLDGTLSFIKGAYPYIINNMSIIEPENIHVFHGIHDKRVIT